MKPRLLVIVGRFVIGGHATDNIPLLYHLKERYTIKIIYGEKEADEIEPLFLLEQFPGLDVQKLSILKRSINPFKDLITLVKIYKCIRSFKPDVVHTHGAKAGFAGRFAAFLGRTKVVVHTFHGHLFHSYFNKFVSSLIIAAEKIMAFTTDAAVALSSTQKRELVQQFKILPERKVFEIPLGLFQPDEKSYYKRQFRSRHRLQANEVAIGIIGRIVPIKNHLDFLKAAIQILDTGLKHVKFFIVGDGNDREDLIRYLKEKNISYSLPGQQIESSKFIFTSWIANMYEVIYDLDIVALTSSNEGTPVSLIEAQICGKPVVAYNVGGVKDTFIDNVTGYLVPKGDISTFVNKLIQLIENKELRQAMGDKGKTFSTEKFSKLKEVASMDNLYQMLLKKKGY